MTTITVGSGLGLQGTSQTQQNGPGGSAATGGQGLAQATVNAATGNLVVQTQDEFVSSIGAIDESLLETYNSLGSSGGYDANGWVLSVSSSLGGLTSTTWSSHASFTRTGADGHVATFTYNSSFAYAGGTGAWVNSSDAGVNEYITFSGSGTTGTWTVHEGSSSIIQTYSNATLGRLLTTADLNGNTLTYAYNSTGLVSTVTDASGQSLTLNYGTTATTNHNLLSVTIKAYAPAQLSTTTGPVMQAAFTVVNYVFSGTQLTAVQVTLATGQTFSTQYSYKAGTNLLTQIAQSDGSILNIAYDTSNRVSTLTDGLGRVTSFNYSVAGQTTVTDALGNKTVYHYSASYGSSDELTQVDEPAINGTVNSIKYLYDSNGNVNQVTDAEGRNVYYTYDSHDNLTEIQDALGNTTLRSYDSADHLQTETQYTTPQTVGATLAGTSAGKLPVATASNSVTTYYVYSSDGKENLDYVISPQGRVTQYLYDQLPSGSSTQGERTRSTVFTGASYTVATYGTAPSAATMTTWASAQNPSLTERTDYAYDITGQVLTTTTYGSISGSSGNVVTSNPSVTYSIYDYRGRLLFEIDPDATATVNPSTLSTLAGQAHVTAYAYDGLGRELSVTNGANQKTTYSYSTLATALPSPGTAVTGLGGQSTGLTVTAANGLVTTTVYDADGEVLSVAQAKGSTSYGTTSYFYDTDGHLVMSADPTGVRTIYIYDSRGRQVGVISPQLDPTGTGYNLTETTYNNDNQVVQTIEHGNLVAKAKVSAYLGATASSVFGTGTGNIAPLTLAGIEPTASSLDRKTYAYYDTAGHLIYSIDGAGYVTGHSYDTAGRLLSTTQYASTTYNTAPASIPAVDTAASSITIPTSSSDRTVRYYYDNDGLQTGTLDADGYFTQTVYNTAGQAQETIAYANAPVIPTGYTAATATTTLLTGWTTKDPVHDQTSWVLYNNQGLVIATIDADGYLTQTHYDAAGNKTSQTRYATALTNYATYTGGAYTVGPPGTTGTYVVTTSAQDQTQSWTKYDGLNRVVTATDYQGTVTQYNYDSGTGFLDSVVSAYSPSNPQGQTNALGMSDGRTTSYFYNALGRVTETLTGLGSAAYQASGYNNATLASDGSTTVYDLAGRKIQSTDADGHSSWYYYDSDSRLAYTVDALGDVTGYQYDAFGDVSQTTQYATAIATTGLAGGLVTTTFTSLLKTSTSDRTSKYSYADNRGLLTKTTDALGFTSTETYDAFGELSSKSRDVGATPGAATRTDTYSYYNRGLLKQAVEDSATGGLALSSSQTYDAFGRVTGSTDANNNTTTTHYGDPLGHIVTVTDALGASSITTYDAFSRVLTQQDRTGAVTTYSYSDSTQTLTIKDPLGNVVTSISNRHGQTIQTIDGTGATTTYNYDTDGNLVSTTDADGDVTQSQYDTADLLKQTTDANGIVTQYAYDAANRVLSKTVDPTGLNLITQYRYDAFGEAFQVTDPTGVVTETVFDNKGEATAVIVDAVQRTSQPAPLMLATQYTYDAESRQLTVTQGMQASGSTGNWSFATAVGTTTTKYVYDHLGRRTSTIVDPNGLKITTKYGYDSDSNLTTQIDADGHVTRYAYDADNRLGYSIDALGDVTGYSYDADGRVTQTTQYATAITPSSVPTNATAAQVTPLVNTSNQANEVTRSVYDAGGHVAYSINATGDVTGYSYDADGRLIETSKYPVPINLSSLPANPAMTDVQRAMALTQQVYSLSAPPSALVQGGSYVGSNPIQFGQGPGSNQLQLTAQTLTSGSGTSASLKGTTVSTISAQSGVVYHAEFSRADTQAGYFLIGAQGSNGSSTLKLFAQISGSTLKAYGSDGTNSFTPTLGTLQTGVTYVSEVEVTATGATLYVYQKGQPRTSGWSYEMSQAWTTAQTFVQVNAATTYGNAVLNISALEEYPAATEVTRTVYDTAGRVAYSIDALGDVTGYSYDADGRVTQTTKYVTPINIGLPADPSVADVQAAMAQSPQTANETAQTVYDAAGRAAYCIDAMGDVTAYAYDADSRVTLTTKYATPIELSSLPANASPVDVQLAMVQSLQNYGLGVQPGTLTQVGSFSGNNPIQFGQGTGSNLLQLTSQQLASGSSGTNAGVKGTSPQSISSQGSVVFHAEFSRADVAAGLFYIGVTGTDTSGNTLKLATSISGGTVKAYVVSGTQTISGSLQTLQAGVTYVSEVVVTASGATLYVYQKGLSRTSGDSYSMSGNWSTATSWAQVNASSSYSNSVTDISDLQEWRAISAANAANQTAETVYDAIGQVAYSIDALGDVTGYQHDADGRLTQTTRYATALTQLSTPIAPGTILSKSTLDGIMASVAGTSDESTINTYDNAGRLLSVQDAALNTESYTYDAFGNKLTDTNKIGNQTAPAGTTQSAWAAAHTWTYQFDADNRMVLDLSPQASADLNGATKGTAVVEATQIVYNAFSDVIKNIQGYYLPAASYVPGSSAFKALRATTSSYDALNRQTGTSSGDGVTGTVGVYNSSSDTVSAEAIASTTQYDAMGNAVVGLDAAGNYSYKVYNAGNQLQYDIDADGYVTGYTYDAFGNQTDITRYANAINAGAAGHTGGQAYTVSQVLAGLSPGSSDRMISTTYDTLNRKLQVTQPIVNYYVPSGTGTADSGAASPLTDYVYDAFSDLIKQSSLIDAAGGNAAAQTWNSTWYGYDTDGHQTSVLDALGYYTANQYDAFGNLAQTTQYAATQNVPIDTATLLANFNGFTATQTPASANSALGYDRTTAYAYDLLNEQTGVTRVGVEYGKQTGSQTTSTTGNLTSTTQYDALGNVIATTDDSGATTYTYYDNVGRVQAVVSPAQQANNIGNYTISSVDLQAALELDRISGGDQVARANGASPLTNVTTYDYSLSLSWSSLAAEGSGSIQIVVDHDGTLTTTTLGNQATSTEVTWAGDATSPVTSITLSMEMPAGSGQFATIITMGEIPIGSPPFDGTSYGSASQQSLLVSGINPGATAATLSCTGASSGATASWSPSLQSIGNGIWTAAMPTTAQLAVGTYSYTLAATVNGVSTPLQSGNLSLAAPAGEDPSITSDAGGQILPLSVMQYDVLGDEVVQTRYEQGAALINSGGSYAIVGTSADDQTTIQAFNALGWMTSTTDADKNTTNDAYNPFGHIGKTWRTQTDSVSGAMTQSTVYLYDNDGNQTTTTQRIQNPLDQGVTLISNTVATYDAFGEITQKVTDATQFGSGTNTATTEVEKYDADGRLWETNQGGLITAYEYDLEGNITAQVLLNATAVSSTPVQLAGTAGAIETDYVRDTDGRAIEEVQPGFSAWPSSADGTDPVQMFTAGVAYSGWSAIYNAPPPPPPPPGTSPPSPIRPMVGGGGGNTSMKVTLNWVALSALSGQQVQISVNGEVVETESAADCETGASLAWVDSGDEGGSSLTSATVAIENASGTWVTVRSFGAPSSTLQISTPQVYGVTLSGSISYSYIGTPPSGQPASGTLAATSLVPGAYTCSVTGLASGQYSYSFNLVQAGTGVTSSGTTTYATYTGTFTVSGGAVSSMSTPTTAPTTITPIVWQQLDRWGNAIVSVDPRYGSTVNPFTAPGTVVAAAAPWASYYRYDDQNHNIEVTQPAVDAWLGSGSDNTTVTENKGYTGNSYTYYDADGRVIATEDNSGNESQRFYDSAGQLIEELDPMGAEIRHVYDGLGREVDTLQNNGTTVSRIYDHMNRLLLQQTSGYTSGPRFTRYAYDELGNRISQDTGISGNITDTNAATENTDGMITQYRYDTQGNVVQELDPGRAGTTVGSAYTVSYTFDSQQHKLSQTDGNDITQVWTYDAFGHTRTYKDLGGLKTTYSYDNFGRLQSQSTPASSQTINGAAAATGNQNQVYGYYENGELQSITDNTNDTLTYYEYDAAGNRTTERMILTTGGANPAFAGTLSDTRISYDALNRETEVRSSYEVVDYLYDADGNRRRVYAKYYTGEDPYTSHTQDYWYSYDDDNRINVSEGVLSNGTVTTDATTGKGIVNDYDSGGDRAEMVQYEKSGSTYQQAVYTYSFDPDNRIVGTTRQAGSGPQVEISTRTYDTQGRTTEYASYDPAGSVASGTIDANATMTATTYNTRGLVQTQTDYAGTTGNTWDAANTSVEYSTPSGGSVKDKNGNLVAGYDGAGNVLAYQVKGLTGTTYTQDYSYQYLLLGSNYKEAYIYGSGTASAGGFTPGSTNEYYDSNDNLISLNKSGGTYQSETFVNTLAGEALSSVNNVSGTTSTTTDTSYLYANNDPIGSISSDSSVGANFDFNYTPVSDQYPSSTPGQYVAQAGDTLEGVAYAVYGDSSLWYLIADANGLSDGVMLNAGQTLTIPNQITNIHNSSSTYQPYDAAKVVGNTTPTLKYLPPPPPPPVGASCGIAMIIVIIVTVIVTVVTEGATSELLGEETAADGSIALEAGSVAATIGPTATGIVAGAVGAAAGSVAGQLVGMALGVQKNFSWSAVGTAALGGAISAGVGDIPNGGSPLADVGKAVLSNVATQGVDIAIGQQKSFSWAGVAAAAVSAGLEIAENGGKAADLSQPKVRFGFGDVASGLSNIDWGKVAEGTFNGLVSGSVKALLTSNGHEQFASIAADAFGNALANGMVAAAQFQAQIDQLGAAGQDSYAFWIGQGKSPQEALALGKGADQSAAAPGSPAVTTPDNASAGAESPTVSAPSPFGSLPASGGVNWGGSLAFPVTPLPDLSSAVPTAPAPYTVGPEGTQGYWGVARAMLGPDASNADVENLTQQLMTANPGVTTLHLGQQLNLGDGTISQQALQTYGAMNQGFQASLQAKAATASLNSVVSTVSGWIGTAQSYYSAFNQSVTNLELAAFTALADSMQSASATSAVSGATNDPFAPPFGSTSGPSASDVSKFLNPESESTDGGFMEDVFKESLKPGNWAFGGLYTLGYNYANRIPSATTTILRDTITSDPFGNIISNYYQFPEQTKTTSFLSPLATDVEESTSSTVKVADAGVNTFNRTFGTTTVESWSGEWGEFAALPIVGGVITAGANWFENPATFTPAQRAVAVPLDIAAGTGIAAGCDTAGTYVGGGIAALGGLETFGGAVLVGAGVGVGVAGVCNWAGNSIWGTERGSVINWATSGSAPVGLPTGGIPWSLLLGRPPPLLTPKQPRNGSGSVSGH